jgi:hypothetical protein
VVVRQGRVAFVNLTVVLVAATWGALLALIFMNRRALRIAYRSGYWGGRNDEMHFQILLDVLSSRGVPLDKAEAIAEAQQIIAQQCEIRLVGGPDDQWPTWDGVDRLIYHTPDEMVATFLPPDFDRTPSFMKPWRWPWQARDK